VKKILVTGSRNWANQTFLFNTLDNLFPATRGRHIMIHGACEYGGADRLAGFWAESRGWWVCSCPAEKNEAGRIFGAARNLDMARVFQPDRVIAFPLGVSRGTQDMIRVARQLGIQVDVFGPDAKIYQ